MRKLAIITGSRGDYSAYSSVLDAIKKHSDLSYELIVTCMHLDRRFDYTVNEIKKDHRNIGALVPMLKYPDTLAGMVKNTGVAVIGITGAIEKLNPDVILVIGDRGEQLAAAMAGAHMNIPVAHLHGGEVSGTIDECIRHAITKFSHIHLVATRKSRQRIIKMGEKKENVYLVGAPGVDALKQKGRMSREEVANYFGFDHKKRILLVVQHPVTTEFASAATNMKVIVEALKALNEQTIFISSNSDAGYTRMMKKLSLSIRKPGKKNNIRLYVSLPHEIYLSLLKNTDVMVGNSSSGIVEAPSCNTPYVLVGTRQDGREKARSIIVVDYNKKEVLEAIDKALYDKKFKGAMKTCSKPYDPFGDDNAGKRVAEVLANFKITPGLLEKRITY